MNLDGTLQGLRLLQDHRMQHPALNDPQHGERRWVDCRDSEDWHRSFRWFLCQQYDADDEIWNMLFSVCERSTSEHNWRGRKTRWYVFHDDAETVDWFPKGKLTDDQVKATALAIWRTRDQSRFPYPSE